MLTPNQAAKKAGVSRKTIMNHIRDMSLKAIRNNANHWVIQPTDLANWIKAREKAKRLGSSPSTTPLPTVNTTDTITTDERIELVTAKLELQHTRKELETATAETTRLREEVQELKAEMRQTREEVASAWKVAKELVEVVVSATKPQPLLLTEEYRVDKKPENLFNDPE